MNYVQAIHCQKHFGLPKSLLHSLLVNCFHFPEDYRDTLEEYYILHWSPEYYFQRFSAGTLRHGETDYLVVYNQCTPAQVRKAKQIRLSFRKAWDEVGIPTYVLVRTV